MKIAVVDYLNAAPLWWGLKAGNHPGGWEICFRAPALCAQMLRSGEAQVAIIPSLEFDRIPDLCMPVPLGVACSGAVRSVLLFSRGPVPEVRTVLLDPSSRTSHGLLRILLRGRTPSPPRFSIEPWDGEELGEGQAALLIGDRALHLGAGETRFEVMDLGAAWHEETSLPFVFALWAARKLPDEEVVAETLLQSYLYGSQRIEEIVGEYAPRVGLSRDSVRDYLTVSLHHPLREADYEGLREFWERAWLESGGGAGGAP